MRGIKNTRERVRNNKNLRLVKNMINRKMAKRNGINQRRNFLDHYFKMVELSETGNDKIWDRLDKIDSVKDFDLKKEMKV